MASIGELFIELGIKADTQKINTINAGFKSLRTNLLLVSGAFTGALIGLDRFIDSALRGVVSLQNLNNQTDLSIEKLQQYQQAGQLSNLALSADQIAQSIANVQKNLANIKIGQGNIAPFQLLGIDVAGADAFSVIEQLRESIKGIDPAIATNLIAQLGLTPDFINILKLSRKEFEALSENIFLNPKQRFDIDKLGTSIKALTLKFKSLKDQAVAKIAPALDELVQKFFKWLKDNGDKIIKTIASIANAFTSFASAVGSAFDITSRFLENILEMNNGIKILATAFGFLALSFSPFLAGLAAVILLLDDISVFKSGGKSLIGDLVDIFSKLPNLAKILGGGAGLALIISSLSGIAKVISAMAISATALANPLASIVASLIFLASSPKIGEKIGEKLDKFDSIQKLTDYFFGSKPEDVLGKKGREFLATPQGQNVYNNTYNINGLQSPVEVGSEIKKINKSQEENNRIFSNQGRGIK